MSENIEQRVFNEEMDRIEYAEMDKKVKILSTGQVEIKKSDITIDENNRVFLNKKLKLEVRLDPEEIFINREWNTGNLIEEPFIVEKLTEAGFDLKNRNRLIEYFEDLNTKEFVFQQDISDSDINKSPGTFYDTQKKVEEIIENRVKNLNTEVDNLYKINKNKMPQNIIAKIDAVVIRTDITSDEKIEIIRKHLGELKKEF